MKSVFYMLVGLPGSGKSSLAQKLIKERTMYYESAKSGKKIIWISSDKIREDFYGSEDIQGDSKEVFAEMKKRTEAALGAGNDVIYDACNINSKKRRAFLEQIKKFRCEKICVICATPYQLCLERDNGRDRVVGENVIRKMYLNWKTPYYYEGWDKISIYFADASAESYGRPREFVQQYMKYDQENPHHLETLGEHLNGTMEYLINNGKCLPDDNLAIAGLLHDCGKPFTKAFLDSKGNKTEIAHYYQHACTGAYDALFFQYPNKAMADILEISLLINLHMQPISWGGENKKKERLLGKKVYEDLLTLNEADNASRRFLEI